VRRRFQVANRAGTALPAVPVGVAGEGFGPAGGFPARLLAPGESAIYEVTCAPAAAGALEGRLEVGERRIPLRAAAVEPPLPRPRILVTLAETRSARQGRVEVALEEASRTRAAGELRVAFEPAEPRLASDPAIAFASGLRTAPFTVEEGDLRARFGSGRFLDFQTGSTAGTLTFTVEAGGYRESTSVVVPAAPPEFSSARALRTATSLEVSLTGLDNTRSVSQVSFTFFGKDGAALPAGPIVVDCAALFRQYFDTSALGGVFALRAVFPVSGPAGEIQSVEAGFAGPAGTGRAVRVAF
jgi:hypothetical protein